VWDPEKERWIRRQAEAVADLMKRHDVGFWTHMYGNSIEYAHDENLGLLGPRAILSHCTGISERAIGIMRETGAHAAHHPRAGRIYTYDPTGGRYEESDFHADGSGGRDARTTVKLGWTDGMERAAALELAIQALYEAADEDSATGGPDAVRGIYPTLATITDKGYEAVPEAEVAERFAALIEHKSAQGRLR